MPTMYHVIADSGMGLETTLQVAVMTVVRTEQLAPALAQHQKSVVIENEELKEKFSRLVYWQEARWWILATLVYWLLSQAIANQYKIEGEWHIKWKIEQSIDGKITLTPHSP